MPETLAALLWVSLGAAIGTPLRFFLSGFVGRRLGKTFPWGTFVINATGALAIGVFAAFASGHGIASTSPAWLFVVTGVLGSYTTVSSFALQTLNLARNGEQRSAWGYVALSLGVCLFAAALGVGLGQSLTG